MCSISFCAAILCGLEAFCTRQMCLTKRFFQMDLKNFPRASAVLLQVSPDRSRYRDCVDQGQTLIGRCNFQNPDGTESCGKKSTEYEDLWCWCYSPARQKDIPQVLPASRCEKPVLCISDRRSEFPGKNQGKSSGTASGPKEVLLQLRNPPARFPGKRLLRSGMVGNLKPYMWIMIVKCF